MNLYTYLSFVFACIALVVIPGPNVAIIIANSLKHGTKVGMITVAGTAAAQIIQLSVVTFGLAAILENIGNALMYIKWVGAAYLIYIGYITWHTKSDNIGNAAANKPNMRKIFMRGFIVSISNPKSLVFFGAFFPQFLIAEQNITQQLAILSITFFVVATILDSSWTLTIVIAKKLLLKSDRFVNKISGGFLILGGGLLAIMQGNSE